ncbi:MAG: heat shock protein DnaJ domain-containing protein, partial [Rhodospirillaceae bacterium]
MASLSHDPKGYYAILKVDQTASAETIKAAFRTQAKRLHPDRNPAPDAVEKFQVLSGAYQILSNPRKRAAYDAECAAMMRPGNRSPSSWSGGSR